MTSDSRSSGGARLSANRLALLYDDDCGFCRWALGWVLRWDRRRRLRPVAIQSPEGQRLLAPIAEDRRLDSWHMVDGAGIVRSAGAAAPALLRLLPGGGPLAALAAHAPRLTQGSYERVVGRRSMLGRLVTEVAKARADALIAERS